MDDQSHDIVISDPILRERILAMTHACTGEGEDLCVDTATPHPPLTAESAGASLIGPAGHKSLLVSRVFSNPYVDWMPRAKAQQAMWDALIETDCDRFRQLAKEYDVTYVMTATSRTPSLAAGRCGLEVTGFPGRDLKIYRVATSGT